MTDLSGANLSNGAAVGPQGEGRESPSSFPKYSAYKDSGVEWLGDVPVHWNVLPVKWVGWLKGGAGFPHDKQGVDSHELDFHKVNALASADSDGVLRSSENTITRETAKELGAYIFPKGTIVFAKVGAALLLGRLRTISAEACLDNNMMGLIVFTGRVSNQFALYSMGTVRFDLIANPGAVPSLNEGQIGNYRLAIPGLPEQTQIARFLDHETARIDALIEEQKRLIELLKEKRQAVISHAVTKGIDPTVPMKDSGVEWLGEVPAHWEALTLGRVADGVKTGGTPSENLPSSDVMDGVEWFTPGDFASDLRLVSSDKFVSKLAVKSGDAKVFPAGAVLIVSIGATLGKVGYILKSASANQQINAVIPSSKIDGCFLAYSLSVKVDAMRFLSNSSTIGIMNQEKTKEIWLSLPPLKEQQLIIEFLDKQASVIDTLIREASGGVSLLQERRSALISAAVTGKIDVRGWQPPASAPTPELVQEAV